MKKLVLLALFVLNFYQINLAQEIKAFKTFGGVRFEMDTLTLGLNQVLEIMKDIPPAYAELKIAKTKYNVAGALGFIGVVLIAVPLGTTVYGGSPEWGLAAGGAVLLLSSIPFNRSFRGHTMQALDIYNDKIKTARIKPELQLYGLGMRLLIRI